MDSIQNMLWFNIQANLGSYLDSCDEIAPPLFYTYSKTIPDAYSNLGFLKDGGAVPIAQVQEIERAAAAKKRNPAIWQVSGQAIPADYEIASREVWMMADTSVRSDSKVPPGCKIRVHTPLPVPEMVALFDEVYCQGRGDTGYTAMAPEYVAVYCSGVPNPPARAFHIGVYIDNECVAIATVTIIGKMAGLYSVAVSPNHRRKGLGRLVSTEGVRLAAKEGASNIILQTEADSPLQKIYESVGFRPMFASDLLTK